MKGEIVSAYDAREQALVAYIASGDVFMTLATSALLALNPRQQGRLQQSAEICERRVQYANENGVSQNAVAGTLLAIWGEVLAELNDLDGALQRANQGVKITECGMDVATLAWSYLCQVRVLLSRSDVIGAAEIVDKMRLLTEKRELPLALTNLMSSWCARVWLAQGKLPLLSKWDQQQGLDPNGDLPFLRQTEYVALCRILIAQRRLDEALKLLQRLLETPGAAEHVARTIEVLILQAITFQAEEDEDRAVVALERALTLAEPEGFFRIFVDEGPQMASLLYKAGTRGVAPEYTRRLLAAFPVSEPDESSASDAQASEYGLFEPLSERELDVLQLIGEGLSNNDIGSKLFISAHTVKTHTRNIYAKVGVHSRTAAVARARALGILPSSSPQGV